MAVADRRNAAQGREAQGLLIGAENKTARRLERSLHTGEVQGSIPCAPTIIVNEIRYLLDWLGSGTISDWHLQVVGAVNCGDGSP
jgi:hypothetical protein